jgi:hypothetical protein
MYSPATWNFSEAYESAVDHKGTGALAVGWALPSDLQSGRDQKQNESNEVHDTA